MSWDVIVPGGHKRHVNDILGLLLKNHFPGLVDVGGGRMRPPQTLDHFALVPDHGTMHGRTYVNVAEHVRAELWVSLPLTIFLNILH